MSALLALVSIASLAADGAGAPPMLAGAWQQTSIVELVDNETRALTRLSESTTTVCLSAAALARPPLSPEKITRSGGTCEPVEREVKPGRSAEVWRISCRTSEGKKYRMVSEIEYSESSMRSVLHSVSELAGEVVEGRVTTESKRIGECTPEMAVF